MTTEPTRGAVRRDLGTRTGIYAYWEGDKKHWFYDVCWQTVRRLNPAAVLLSRRDVEDVLGAIPAELNHVYLTHRVDWIRKAFIARTGGLWVDLDFVCWADLAPLAEASQLFDYIGWKELHGTGWMDNFFAARQGSPIVVEAAANALAEVRRQGKNLAWLSTNADTMNTVMQRHADGCWIAAAALDRSGQRHVARMVHHRRRRRRPGGRRLPFAGLHDLDAPAPRLAEQPLWSPGPAKGQVAAERTAPTRTRTDVRYVKSIIGKLVNV